MPIYNLVCSEFWSCIKQSPKGYCSKRYDVNECVTCGVYWVNLNFKDCNLINALRECGSSRTDVSVNDDREAPRKVLLPNSEE